MWILHKFFSSWRRIIVPRVPDSHSENYISKIFKINRNINKAVFCRIKAGEQRTKTEFPSSYVVFIWLIFKHFRSPGIDSLELIPLANVAWGPILKVAMGAWNWVGIELSYRPARGWRNRFLGSLKVYKWRLWGGIFKLLRSPEIDSNESIPPAYIAWQAGTFLRNERQCYWK